VSVGRVMARGLSWHRSRRGWILVKSNPGPRAGRDVKQLGETVMPIEFHCLECMQSYEVDDDLVGKTIRCRECYTIGRVEAPLKKAAKPPRTTVPDAGHAQAGNHRTACPSCKRVMLVPADVLGKMATCPGCGAVLTVKTMGNKTILALAGVDGDAPTCPVASPSASALPRSDAPQPGPGPAPTRRRLPRPGRFAKSCICFGCGACALLLGAAAIFVVLVVHEMRNPPGRSTDQLDRDALFLAEEGEWHKAHAVIEQAIIDDPQRPSHWIVRGDMHMMRTEYQSARDAYATALRLDPDWSVARCRCDLAWSYSKIGAVKTEREHPELLRNAQPFPLRDD